MPANGSVNRLAVYGTLAPGRKNHWVLASIKGNWSAGVVRGRLFAEGWGATEGYPALLYDENGEEVAVQIFESDDLPLHWPRIDAFEGPQYRRVTVPVQLPSGERLPCHIYELKREP